MRVREFAERVLFSESLSEKLAEAEPQLDDDDPGPAVFPERPGRPPELEFAAPRTAPGMPALAAMGQVEQRSIAHHIMANHELQALEVMALVLCGFPDAPADFRRGLVEIMRDEQRHTRMQMERVVAGGIVFGDLPVNGYIWTKSQKFTCPLDYLAGLPLIFEMANLDHSLVFAEAFQRGGDKQGAAVMRTIHSDEIEHVRFGIEWLRKLKPPGKSDWDTFNTHLHWPIRPAKARGDVFQRAARLAAGLDPEFIDRIESADADD
ncbi:MAG: DUF455 family protein [Planctomycetaceae bacterium]